MKAADEVMVSLLFDIFLYALSPSLSLSSSFLGGTQVFHQCFPIHPVLCCSLTFHPRHVFRFQLSAICVLLQLCVGCHFFRFSCGFHPVLLWQFFHLLPGLSVYPIHLHDHFFNSVIMNGALSSLLSFICLQQQNFPDVAAATVHIFSDVLIF